jgi:hypothetical protein
MNETPLSTESLLKSLMDDSDISKSDLILPKILLMQGLSKFVSSERARMGEFRDSLNSALLGGKDNPLEIIIFKSSRFWQEYEIINDSSKKIRFLKQYPIVPDNELLPWNDKYETLEIQRNKVLNFFVLLTAEISDEIFLPKVLSLKKTSYITAKKLETFRAKFKAFGKPMAFKTFKLVPLKQENEKGAYYIFDIEEGRKTTDHELLAVSKWFEILNNRHVEVDNSDIDEEPLAF